MSCSTSDNEDFEEGVLEPNYDDFIDNRQICNPFSIDYNTWKRDVGGLIRSENHVLLDDDEQLRLAITQAMFLETASENLLKKRKQQIELLDGLRGEEGDVAGKLFDDVRGVLQSDLGARYEVIEYSLTTAIAKSKLPFDAPDTTQPPPSMIQLPPMHLPPPNMAVPPPQLLAPPTLISQHLVPPPVTTPKPNENWSEKVENVHEEPRKHENVIRTRGAFRFPLGDRSISWRAPFHPTPLPPPIPSPFLSSHTRLPTPFKSPGTSSQRRSFPLTDRPPSVRSPSPPGLVGVNVRGLFVGNRRLNSPFRRQSPGINFKR